jgi:hexokinase
MGGTNIRVCIVTFNGDGTYASGQNKVAIPTSLMSSNNPKDLFDWVARMVQTFIEGLDTGSTAVDSNGAQWRSQTTFDLGFTFSHAVQQRDVNSGTLIRWSKGFDIEGVVGQDVCALLQDAFDALGLRIRVTALVNDTVGTLLAQAYMSHGPSRTFAGAVFGTGTNGAYVERASNITKLGDDVTDPEAIMVVNSEWGNFDQARRFLTSTTYDRAIDAASVNPDFEIFEKQISGMYLGEILRVVVLSLSKDATVDFFGCVKIPDTSELYIPWSLDSSFLSHLESDNSLELAASRFRIAQWLGNVQISFEVASAIRTIAHVIVLRSARLSAVALGAFLVQTACLAKIDGGQERVSIGVDGSLIELYPGFITHIRCALRSIKGVGAEGEARVDITIAKDGSGVGAALAAHIAAMQLS